MKCKCIRSFMSHRIGEGGFVKGIEYEYEYHNDIYYIVSNRGYKIKFYKDKWCLYNLFKDIFSDYFEDIPQLKGEWFTIKIVRDKKIDDIINDV